jgi:multidrug efflux pump subunit AcrB
VKPGETSLAPLTRLVDLLLRGDVAWLGIVVSLAIGAVALWITPREEEPQIVVPMADVLIEAPGLSAEEVERQVTLRLEKLLSQIDGVEYVYSSSQADRAVVTVRFYVGEDREDSLLKLYDQLESHRDQVPPSVRDWVVKPIEIDDVPIVVATLWSTRPAEIDDHALRRIAEELQRELQATPDANRVWLVGGRPRRMRVEVDPLRLAARQTTLQEIAAALRAANVEAHAGQFDQLDQRIDVRAGQFFRDARDLGGLVIKAVDRRPVYLRDVATLIDGPAELESVTWLALGPAAGRAELAAKGAAALPRGEFFPAVHLAVAKRAGANAVTVAHRVRERLEQFAAEALPAGVETRITRDYGETANDKVNELVEGLAVAVLTVVGLIGVMVGWRAALVVALAIPVCYSLTLAVNFAVGYTINRVTLFALILALGLLVDDPITDVENIARYFKMRTLPPRDAVLRAIQEVRPALIMSTLAIVASFLPLAFITGMMGPYMAPMALNVPLTVTVSTVVAFCITPWLAMVALRGETHGGGEQDQFDLRRQPLYRLADFLLRPALRSRRLAWAVLAGIGLLMLAALIPPLLRGIPLKMLPYDNKNEFQVVVDMPEGTTLERTDAACRAIGAELLSVAEVSDVSTFAGCASPMDFNGLVRHYFLRSAAHEGDLRVNLAPKDLRQRQSHAMVLELRDRLQSVGDRYEANVKLVEVPPGPPVLATLTAEVYGPRTAAWGDFLVAAEAVKRRMAREPGVVDVDWSAEDDQVRWEFVTDKPKAALSGVTVENVARTLQMALGGERVTVLHEPHEVDPLWIELRLPRELRSALDDLRELYVAGEAGQLVQLGGLGEFVETTVDKTIYHKNLQRVMFVYGEVAGRPPAEAIVDMQTDLGAEDGEAGAQPRSLAERSWVAPGGGLPWRLPPGFAVEWAGEGEWKITLDVFRDLGLAFAAALAAIFLLLMFQTGSRLLPLIIMAAIPLSLIGILPGFWLLNAVGERTAGGYGNPVFFTATAMIGMIALAGIVIRNSVVLLDFIRMAQEEGTPLEEAIVQSVAVRTRPIVLTAGTTLLGNWVITLDPVFSGLAWAIIFGIVTSTLFTLAAVPLVYWQIYRPRTSEGPVHGLSQL